MSIMDDSPDNDATPSWPVSESQYQPGTPEYVSSTTNTFQTSQAGDLTPFHEAGLSDAHLHSLAQVAGPSGLHIAASSPGDLHLPGSSGLGIPGPSRLQQVFTSTGYHRASPDEDFQSNSVDTLQQYRTMSPDGSHQIIRMAASSDGRALQHGYVTVLLGTQGQAISRIAPSLASSSAMASALSSVQQHHHIAALGEASVSGSLVRQQSVTEADSHTPLLSVVNSLPQLSQVESTTNEASPLATPEAEHGVRTLGLVLQRSVDAEAQAKQDLDSFSNEPDTTGDDLKPSPYDALTHGSSFVRAAGSLLDLSTGSDANGLDSTMGNGVGAQLSSVSSQLNGVASQLNGVTSQMDDVGSHMRVMVHSHLDGSVTGHLDRHLDGQVASHLEGQVDSNMSGQVTSHLLPTGLAQAHTLQLDSYNAAGLAPQQHLDVSSGDLAQVLVAAGPSSLQMTGHEHLQSATSDLRDLPLDPAEDYFHGYREQVRKSERIAHLERPLSPVVRPSYTPKEYYNTEELWCEDCQNMFLGGCPKHRLQEIYDKVVLSRAWASLPPQLQIFRLGETTELGVFAKKTIPKRTQFGPFIGEVVDSSDKLTNPKFILQVERAGGDNVYFEATDENKCNWMMFVRPAQNWGEQNMVAYQYGIDVYFCTIKNIDARQELKVWYSAPYAARLGQRTHQLNDEDLDDLDDSENTWPCYDCNKRFRSGAQLQKHLIQVHDDKWSGDGDEKSGKRKGSPGKGGPNKSKKNAEKLIQNTDSGDESAGSSGAFQSWKKKKTNIYLNKFNRYRRDTVKKSIKSLYKKKGKASGGQEWLCLHCDLTFDNASLLNLHTLTHAAEDVGLAEVQKIKGEGDMSELLNTDGLFMYPLPEQVAELVCPLCKRQFFTQRELVEHAAEHGKHRIKPAAKPVKPNKCGKCWKAFSTPERLTKHMLVHGDESTKPLQCHVCHKRFMNNSALACHLKIHSDAKYYDCPLCKLGFDQVTALKEHVQIHAINGIFTCPECHRSFQEYTHIRKHMRAFHSDRKFQCNQCHKEFPRHDKLKLHMLKHTSVREFMCETCGRQFKRKDKLKEHVKRMHFPGRTDQPQGAANKDGTSNGKNKFIPKVSPTDYQRFIYKCHTCLLGFKRRGMLVNHLAKRHPDVPPDTVPELNLPILKTQHDYFCQYCDKVYKSTSKRKAHILKNHPGAALPAPNRNVTGELYSAVPNPNFSAPAGSVTTVPHPCQYCHKQYASKAKLLQHQRKKHGAQHAPVSRRNTSMLSLPKTTLVVAQIPTEQTLEAGEVSGDAIHADLLTQAMSELTQNLELRPPMELQLSRLGTTVLQAAPHQSTLELSQLGSTLVHTHFQASPSGLQTIPAHVSTAALLPTTTTQQVVTATMLASGVETIPLSSVASSFLPKSWTTPTSYSNLR